MDATPCVIEGEKFFLARPGLCDLVASVCLTACYCSLYNIGAISFNRYVHIVHHDRYDSIYNLRNGIIISIVLWVISFLLELPNITGWNGHAYDRKTLTCLWDRNYNYYYNLFFSGFGVAVPLVIISTCYFLIFWNVYQSKKKIGTKADGTSGKKDSMRLARTLFIIFIVFALCWTPFTLFVVIDPKDELGQELYMFAILIAHVNSSLNCILYGITNKQFRKGYYKVLGLEKCMNEREKKKAAKAATQSITVTTT
ncbi:melatonin-related receptor-like [Tubulanus polymorphus]|uniref:melatonin-related receptor-like n=1 Tax=Tubulanus polymorphus TaxID=672921 RepID=UPI003DA46FDA